MVNEKHYKLAYCMCICHVMSCRHYCIEFLKKSFSKTFLFFKIIYKYFAGFLACYYTDCHATARNDAIICSHYEGNARSNLLSGLLHFIRNDETINRHYERKRSNPLYLDCHAFCQRHAYGVKARNDDAFCNEIQFDKFHRFFSVIYKKYIKQEGLHYDKLI